MKKIEVTEAIFAIKKEKNLTWEAIGDAVGMTDVWITSACLGMNACSEDVADKLVAFLELPKGAKAALMEYPTKAWDQTIPQDPLIYRLYEVVGVYGPTLKEVIEEKFGYGIMSAIDFSMSVDREENPKGDRVVVTMSGKFLPYSAW